MIGPAPSLVLHARRKVDVITLVVEELDRSKAFYENLFGLSVVYEGEDSAVFRFEYLGAQR